MNYLLFIDETSLKGRLTRPTKSPRTPTKDVTSRAQKQMTALRRSFEGIRLSAPQRIEALASKAKQLKPNVKNAFCRALSRIAFSSECSWV